MSEVDNSILEAAVSILEMDTSRRLFIRFYQTAVNCDQFITGHEGVRVDPDTGNYVYKNLEWLMDSVATLNVFPFDYRRVGRISITDD